MNWLTFSVDRPVYLLLLLLVPVIWWTGRRSLSGLPWMQRWLAIGLRSGILVLLVLALADAQLVKITDRLAALFLVDQSASIDSEDRQAVFGYVRNAVERHRDVKANDAAGIIVFGREAQIEHPPHSEGSLPIAAESHVDAERTNIGDALKLAKASFPEGTARRVVVVSDGNQNLGDAVSQARDLSADGVSIDVAPLPLRAASDVVVTKVATPSDIRQGSPFDVTIVVENRVLETARRKPTVRGRLVVTRKVDQSPQLIADEPVELPPGKQIFRFRQELDESAFYTYEARFVPDDPAQDRHVQNNLAASFTQLRGKGRVLFIVNSETPTEFDPLVATLRREEMDVTVQTTAALFGSLQELQNYDCVVLANVPRTSGSSADSLVQFTDEQIEMLVRNVEQLGAGLVMLGGPDSFGAGGWANTSLEKAMPVDFQIRNAKVNAVGALMLVIDKSGSMDGQKLQMCKAAAKAAAKMLGPSDHIGVIAFDVDAEDIVRLQRVGDRPHRLVSMIDRLASGGGTNMEPAVRRGYDALKRVNASVKHMIVLTDGQTNGSGYPQLAAANRKNGITTTAVAVGTDAAKSLLQDIASRGGGKYYQATNPRALPRIFTLETRRVVRPLVLEEPKGMLPQVVSSHEMMVGIDGPLPPITGYVMTTVKENPLVETPLLAPRPGHPNNTLLASWTFGMGRTVAFTTDSGQRWTKDWSGWDGGEKLLVQMVRYAMRPVADSAHYSLATDVHDGKLRVVVQAISDEGYSVSGLSMDGSVVCDDGSVAADIRLEQVGPGKYVAETPLDQSGTHLVAVRTGPRQPILRAGVNVPYSPEYRDFEANEPLLLSLAAMQPSGGSPGEIIRLPENREDWSRWPGPNVFRRDLPPARMLSSIWPLLLLVAAGAFLGDVLNRRVLVSFHWVGDAWRRVQRKPASSSVPDERLDRLKAKKREAASQRFAVEIAPDTITQTEILSGFQAPDAPQAENESPPGQSAEPESEGDDYSDRLLKAVRAARRGETKRNSPR